MCEAVLFIGFSSKPRVVMARGLWRRGSRSARRARKQVMWTGRADLPDTVGPEPRFRSHCHILRRSPFVIGLTRCEAGVWRDRRVARGEPRFVSRVEWPLEAIAKRKAKQSSKAKQQRSKANQNKGQQSKTNAKAKQQQQH